MATLAADLAFSSIMTGFDTHRGGLFVVGICGAQGSGKSTLARDLAERISRRNLRCVILSIDDLYLTLSERHALAQRTHPLFRVRGVPGTHDVDLGLHVIDALERREPISLPRFDKSMDDRSDRDSWPLIAAGADILIFEGWCVGARPEPAAALYAPLNRLEREEDPDGTWRTYVNHALAHDYQILFSRIDYLVMLAAPGFDIVRAWRMQQEHELRNHSAANAPGLLPDEAIGRFVQFYERLTKHVIKEMPARAMLTLFLNDVRGLAGARQRTCEYLELPVVG